MSDLVLSYFESSPVVSFCIPVAASRYLLHLPDESRASRVAHALMVLAVAIPNRIWSFEQPDDNLLFAPVAAAIVGSFFHAYLRSQLVERAVSERYTCIALAAGLSAIAGAFVSAAFHAQFLFSLRLTTAVVISWGSGTLAASVFPAKSLVLQNSVCGIIFLFCALSTVLDSIAVFLFPTRELVDALTIVEAASEVGSSDTGVLDIRRATYELLFLTMCVKFSMGFIGIDYMRTGQTRKLTLLNIKPSSKDTETKSNICPTSRTFIKSSVYYVLFSAFPYMLWRGSMETVNSLAFSKVQQRIEADFLHSLFQSPATSALNSSFHTLPSTVRLQKVASSNFTVSSYADSVAVVTKTSFELFSRKCFSIPKMALFPGLFLARPGFVASVLPISVGLDMAKGWISASLTMRARELRKDASVLKSQQQRIQEHDIRNEQQIRLNYATIFTRDRWVDASIRIKNFEAEASMLESLRGYLNWLYWSDILKVGIDVMISALLEDGTMATKDVMVASRVVEDAIDTMLMRSRAEADLATLATDAAKLHSLVDSWKVTDSSGGHPEKAAQAGLVPCVVSQEQPAALTINGLAYARGHASVWMDGLRLPANGNMVAVTGANGCGKSTSFAVFAAGACTERPIDLPASVIINTSAARNMSFSLPGKDVVTVSQVSYFPLFSRPIDWFLARDPTDDTHVSSCPNDVSADIKTCKAPSEESEEEAAAARLALLGNELQFFKESKVNASMMLAKSDDWYGSLSGGQRSKADFIRQVFARKGGCPSLLLVDEGFAALDPGSKALVQSKLKTFCSNSLVLIIYHTDTASEEGDGDASGRSDESCIQPGFFNANLHFEDGIASLRPLCGEDQ